MNKSNLIWIFAILLFININGVNGFIYELELNYNQGDLSLLSVDVIDEEFYEPSGLDYYADIIGRNNELLDSYLFGAPSFILFDIYNPETGYMEAGGIQWIDEENITLELPYYSQGERIDIYNVSELEPMLSIDISHFSQTNCGDNICTGSESFFTCPQDCLSGELDNYCDSSQDNKCDPDCSPEEDQDCLEGEYIQEINEDKSNQYLLIGGLILILIIIIILILRERRKSN
jgi:hypothetical protein